MGFFRRLLGGPSDADAAGPSSAAITSDELDAEERAHELELARFEQGRTSDLVRRQQRYTDRSWTPPAQGGPERADDVDAAEESGDRSG